MIPPDLIGCPIHGDSDLSLRRDKAGRQYKPHCLACQRERDSPRHYNGPRCINGHLKTPWTWVYVGKRTYRTCRPCALKNSRARYARVRAARVTSDAAA